MAKILVIKVSNRPKNAVRVQEILTRFGCNIKTRLGIHEFSSECEDGDEGIIILELIGEQAEIEKMMNELERLDAVKVIYQEL